MCVSKSSEEVRQDRKPTEKQKEKEEDEGEEEDECVDSENVNELSDLFSTIESEYDDSAIDFSVLLEGEHAINVEEVSEIFTDLETASAPVGVDGDVEDAVVVDEMAELFSSLESQHETDSDRDSMELADEEADDVDAENVDELSELFSSLEEKEELSQDWIAALEVEDVSSLYSELERLEEVRQEEDKPVAPSVSIDPRIFVPKFSVRMEGSSGPVHVALPRISTGGFLAGPPGLLAGPPVRLNAEPSALEKRKCVALASARTPDPSISETRRICAAKRRRVNGRFVREQNTFVSITSLQP